MKDSDLIKEISENLKELPVAFRYLYAIKDHRGEQNKQIDNSKVINLKPMPIDKYQTHTYMQSGTYFKPMSRCFLPTDDRNDEISETI